MVTKETAYSNIQINLKCTRLSYIDNICVEFWRLIFKQNVKIQVGTSCLLLLVTWLIVVFKSDRSHSNLSGTQHILTKFFFFLFHSRCINDAHSLNNPHLKECLHLLNPLNPSKLKIKNILKLWSKSASLPDVVLGTDSKLT